ncbi:MAG TPA: hypothetical protein VGK32_12950 [Vicinamibacterales bacterium]
MAPVEHLTSVSADEAQRLRRAGIDSAEELWRRAALVPLPPASDPLEPLADATTISRDRLAELLAREALAEADACNDSPWLAAGGLALHLGWCLLLTATLALLYVVLVWPSRIIARTTDQSEAVVVVSPAGLPAYHRIAAGDVARRRVTRRAGTIASPDEIVGHLTLAPLPAGSAIARIQITPGRVDAGLLAARTVLTLPVSGIPPLALRPTRVLLLLSRAGAAGEPVVLDDVVLLETTESGGRITATVAVKQADLPSVATVLAAAEVFIAAHLQ